MKEQLQKYVSKVLEIKKMISARIIGHEELIEEVLLCLFSGGNILLEGVPGLGKTELIKTLSEIMDLKYSRIQFTPDLMPADIIGTKMLYQDEQDRTEIKFEKGPVFCQLLLADEINRATPKTQSALLETMQEHTVTVSGNHYKLKEPFFVLATQNPIEMEGTYPLPEAQVDRFLFKSYVEFPDKKDLIEIMKLTTINKKNQVSKILDQTELLKIQEFVRNIAVPEIVYETVANIVISCHPEKGESFDFVKRYVEYGPGPRAAQALILSAKAYALCCGRFNVALEDIQRVLKPALRHRILLNFDGQSEFKDTDKIIEKMYESGLKLHNNVNKC